jgi:CBS domain-containing protein
MTWETKRLGDVAHAGPIRSYTPSDLLTSALQDMEANDYSQVIVHSSGGLALVTVEGVTRWLAQWAGQGKVTLTGVELRDIVELEHEENLLVMSTNQTVREAVDAFNSAISEGRPRLYAIVITETGESTGSPVGIVTPEDLVE